MRVRDGLGKVFADESFTEAFGGHGAPGRAPHRRPRSSPARATKGPPRAEADEQPQLLKSQEEDDFLKRWEKIQTTFVDDPCAAVQAADSLVANIMQTLAATCDEHKYQLEEERNRSGQTDTEALRTALRHYRSLFSRLLTS
jgi:hypothetical protein